jgi:HSP20 family protein
MTFVKFNTSSRGQNTPGFSKIINDLMENDFPTFRPNTSNLPAVNISETELSYHIELSIPGFTKTDISIAIDGDTLTISGEKADETEKNQKKYSRKEFSFQNFKRSFTMPDHIDNEKVAAKFEDGILSVEIPKKETVQATTRKIHLN